MMSLFSSFDLNFFFIQLFFYLVLFSLILNFTYKLSFFSTLYIEFSNYMEIFFNSMKSQNFNKMFCFKIMTFMNIILFLNFTGVWPYNFSFTSQMSIVCACSLILWLSLMMFYLMKNSSGLLSHLVPEGTPIYLTWFLFLIEMVSNIIRPITLTVRLVANILAGHLLMILLFKLVSMNFFIFPSYLLLNSVEIFVSLIQSYIFVTMVVLYFAELE